MNEAVIRTVQFINRKEENFWQKCVYLVHEFVIGFLSLDDSWFNKITHTKEEEEENSNYLRTQFSKGIRSISYTSQILLFPLLSCIDFYKCLCLKSENIVTKTDPLFEIGPKRLKTDVRNRSIPFKKGRKCLKPLCTVGKWTSVSETRRFRRRTDGIFRSQKHKKSTSGRYRPFALTCVSFRTFPRDLGHRRARSASRAREERFALTSRLPPSAYKTQENTPVLQAIKRAQVSEIRWKRTMSSWSRTVPSENQIINNRCHAEEGINKKSLRNLTFTYLHNVLLS